MRIRIDRFWIAPDQIIDSTIQSNSEITVRLSQDSILSRKPSIVGLAKFHAIVTEKDTTGTPTTLQFKDEAAGHFTFLLNIEQSVKSESQDVKTALQEADTAAAIAHNNPLPELNVDKISSLWDYVSDAVGTIFNVTEKIAEVRNVIWLYIQRRSLNNQIHPYAKLAFAILSVPVKVRF